MLLLTEEKKFVLENFKKETDSPTESTE